MTKEEIEKKYDGRTKVADRARDHANANTLVGHEYSCSDVLREKEKSYIQGATDQDPISRVDQKKRDIEKAWKWIKDKVELSYTDYDSFIKAMMEQI